MDKMKYISKARSDEHGTAKVPVYNEDGIGISNKVSKVRENSLLAFASDDVRSEYTDVSGDIVQMVCRVPVGDDTVETRDVVEILRTQGNFVVVRFSDGCAYSVYAGIATFYVVNN